MRFILIPFLLLSLLGCASFDELAYTGMDKNDFIDKMTRNQMEFRSIYFDPKTGIEVWVPKRTVKYDLVLNSTAKIAIFENVTRPRPRFTALTIRVPEGYCQNWVGYCYDFGDGKLKSWHSEDELAIKAFEGQERAKLLIAVLQLERDKYNNEIEAIMERDSIARDTAERRYSSRERRQKNAFREAKKIELKRDRASKRNKAHARDIAYDVDQTPRYKSSRDSQNKHNVSTKMATSVQSLFSRLIETAITAYIYKELDIIEHHPSVSENDLRKIEEASRRGTRKALRKQKRMENLQWTAPIR